MALMKKRGRGKIINTATRWAQPEEYAYLVAFLASRQSDFITGQVISPNGGATIVGF